MSLALNDDGTLIRDFARVDVTTDPAWGYHVEPVMHARYDPRSALGPFQGDRLRSALENPTRADILVAASPLALADLPQSYRRMPCILVFSAWTRMMVFAPSGLLELCWHRGGLSFPSAGRKQASVEEEVSLLAGMLVALLHHAPPWELVAWSRGAG